MPISDYASVFFFAHRDRVTLKSSGTVWQNCDCYFRSVPDQWPAPISSCHPGFVKSAVLRTAELRQVKIRARELRTPPPAEQGDFTKRKSPAEPGFDEYLFRSVHFGSFAI
jgi:hypothetical protein